MQDFGKTARVWGPVRKTLQREENKWVIVGGKEPGLVEGWGEENPGPGQRRHETWSQRHAMGKSTDELK